MKIRIAPQGEKAPSVGVDLKRVRTPGYGRSLEEFREGDVFVHPRGLTITSGLASMFAGSFHEANPLYLNAEFAKSLGHPGCPVSPQLVFNVVLSLGVQNDSEKAVANLGYYDAHFLRPVYPGDTIRSLTKVLARKDRGAGKPGIVSIRTLGVNQSDQPVMQYDRKIMVAAENPKAMEPVEQSRRPTVALGFPEVAEPSLELPAPKRAVRNLTGSGTWFEDFKPGEIIVHANGRTITDEHVGWTYRVGNTHPLHYDRLYSSSRQGPMSGEPIVYGGLVFAWIEGIAGRDTSENALATLGFTEGYHTQPAFTGDTVTAISRVLAVSALGHAAGSTSDATDAEIPAGEGVSDEPFLAGVVTFQLIGLKNLRAADGLEKFGEALFRKENAKSKEEKIPEKIFEIERRLLIRTRD